MVTIHRVLLLAGVLVCLCAAAPSVSAAQDRGQAYYYFMLGQHLESAGEFERAVEAYRQAARLDPASGEIPAELASLFARQGRAAEAIEAAEAALRVDRANKAAHRVVGLVYAALAEGRGRETSQSQAERETYARRAIEHLEQAERELPVDSRVELTLARLYLLTGAGDRAVALLTRFVEEDPESAEALFLLARTYAETGRRGDAITMLERVVADRPRLYGALVALAELYEQERRWAEAADAYARAGTLHADDPELRERWAAALLNAGRASQAAELLRHDASETADPTVLYLLAEAERRAGNLDAAERAARQLAARDPDQVRGVSTLAQVLAERGRLDEALAVLQRARPRFPDDATLLFQLGAVHEQRGEYADAERAFRELLARDPAHAPALNYLGYMLAERGERLEESLTLIQRALQLDPDNAAYLDSLGWVYVKLDRLDLAEAPLRRASEELTRNSVVQDHLGDLLFRLGRYDEAIAAWERALAGDRDSLEPSAIERKIGAAREKVRRNR